MLIAMGSKKTEEFVRAMDINRSNHKVVHIISTDHESVLKSDQLALHLNGKGVDCKFLFILLGNTGWIGVGRIIYEWAQVVVFIRLPLRRSSMICVDVLRPTT